MDANIENKNISLVFSEAEAAVFFEWLCHFNEGKHESLFLDPSEKHLLFDLEAELERVLPFLFAENYHEIISDARQRLREGKSL